MFKKALAALTLIISLPATACSVVSAGFHGLLEQPRHAIVIGHYVPESRDTGGRHYSNLFVVTEVIQGDLKPQQYRLMMTGPWGNMCEVSTQEAPGSSEPKDNPVVLLVDRKIDGNTLDLAFLTPTARIVDGYVTTDRRYIKTPQKPYDWKYLDKPQEIKMKLTTFKKWVKSDRSRPAPWQVTRKRSN